MVTVVTFDVKMATRSSGKFGPYFGRDKRMRLYTTFPVTAIGRPCWHSCSATVESDAFGLWFSPLCSFCAFKTRLEEKDTS